MATGRLGLLFPVAAWLLGPAAVTRAAVLNRESLKDVDPLAVCVDGSPAAYYWKPSDTNSSLWIVDLQGGGWCDSEASCRKRCTVWGIKSPLCTSHLDLTRTVEHGLFHPKQDPAVLDANLVFLPYCTSDGHMGDAEALNGLQFRGARVVSALFAALTQRHGLGRGPERNLLIFGGQSAGGRGAMVNLDYVPEMLGAKAASVDVVGFLDSPLWMDMPPLNTSDFQFEGFNESCRRVFSYANVTRLGTSCAAAHGGADRWKCIMGEYRMPHVRTPYLLIASQFDSYQLSKNVGHKPSSPPEFAYAERFAAQTRALVTSLRDAWPANAKRQNAVISWACYSHATSLNPSGYDQQSCGRNGTTLDAAVQQFLALAPASGAPKPLEWLDNCTGFACGAGCQQGLASAEGRNPIFVI